MMVFETSGAVAICIGQVKDKTSHSDGNYSLFVRKPLEKYLLGLLVGSNDNMEI